MESNLSQVRNEFESFRFEFVGFMKEAERRKIPVVECAGREILTAMQFRLNNLIGDVEGVDTELYNKLTTLYNAVTAALE